MPFPATSPRSTGAIAADLPHRHAPEVVTSHVARPRRDRSRILETDPLTRPPAVGKRGADDMIRPHVVQAESGFEQPGHVAVGSRVLIPAARALERLKETVPGSRVGDPAYRCVNAGNPSNRRFGGTPRKVK